MEDNRPDRQPSRSYQQPDDGLNCPSHNRRRWAIDRTLFDWHRWVPLHDRPVLRWALAVALVIVVLAVMVVGIVYTAEYYTAYYASGAWILNHEKSNHTQGVLSVDVVQEIPVTHETGDTLGAVGDEIAAGGLNYIPEIDQITPCDPRWSCGEKGQPVSLFDTYTSLSNSGIYCCNNSTCPLDGHLDRATTCPADLKECSQEEGGGCCPPDAACSTSGCLIGAGHKPDATKTGGTQPTGTVHKMGEVPCQGMRMEVALRENKQPTLQGAAMCALLLGAWGMAVWG
ncbi:hypothetical protein SCUP234_13426 [Seiridium cupressi]